MADDDSSDLSSISSLSAPPSDDESGLELTKEKGILKFFHKIDRNPALEPKEKTPPRPKREPSPPHEYVLADNPDIAFIVMFRARFAEAFPKSLANFGPQELERDVVDSVPGERVEHFLCAVLGLLLNRKQDVKPGHYNRALEEAVQSHKGQWARDWESRNPLSGGATFASMTPVQRLTLLRTLIQWSLASSDAIKSMINQQYKNRHEDDRNIPLSVQVWGGDGDKRRYFLIEGNDDTSFRVYRESNPAGVHRTWWSVAGSIEELQALANKLETQDGGPKARQFAKNILNAIPRFEATEEKRRRREYRQMQKERFRRPEPGFSLYEGRTRGKRMKYTYSDDEAEFLTDSTNRRSTRNTRNHTPAEPSGPVTTASGRQIRAPTRLNAEKSSEAPSAATSVQGDDTENKENELGPRGRPRRSAAVNHGTNGWAASKKRKSEEFESDASDGSEPDFGDDEEEEADIPDESEDEEEFEEDSPMDEDLEDQAEPGSKIFKFPIRVAFDENNKVRQIPGPPVVVSPKNARAAARRNVVVSESSESTGAEDEPEEPEPPAAEEIIAVPAKRASTPQTQTETNVDKSGEKEVKTTDEVMAPPTPSSGPATALAFRGSPEKPVQPPMAAAQAVPAVGDIE
ncbi:hypothetical protein QC761_708240 [Podospora bellae-mahoneyi]|uniref:WHIM1 domain-containing protein n=1 Tax=Podospora bellae-mahoneyi TaxID=2093777 RepID=A0ABR0F6Y1_9PEZI|nr:hypothetical protein QC761_708240 [Podospora bellae-mahoneyi]